MPRKLFSAPAPIIPAELHTLVHRMQQSPDGAHFAELLAFVAVAEELSFTRAALRLGRDATVLSRRVRALETRLSTRLIERTTRSMALTEAGRLYLERARTLVDALAAADEETSGLNAAEPRGHLRLALPGSFGRLWLAPVLADFLAAHPRITIEAAFSNRFVDLIDEGFDAAVRLGELTDSRLVARRVGMRRRLLCASPAYLARYGEPAHPDDLGTRPCLIFSGLPGRPAWDMRGPSGETIRVPVSGPLVTDDAEALLTAAIAGLGILLSTDWLAGHALRAGQLVPVLADWQLLDAGAIYFVTPSGSRSASKTRAFGAYLIERMKVPPWRVEA